VPFPLAAGAAADSDHTFPSASPSHEQPAATATVTLLVALDALSVRLVGEIV
jgi:hypothetical protein